MVIKKLVLHNFQSHKHTEIEFDRKINFIVGRSNSGKTALLRAIKWVLENRPLSTQALKHFDSANNEPMWVELHIEDSNGREITLKRYKSSSENYYQIGNNIYKAIRANVPAEIQELSFNYINIQEQHDPYFLLTLTPHKIAQEINKYTGFEDAEKAIEIVKHFLNTKRSEIKILEKNELELEEKLKQLKIVDKVKPLFDKLYNAYQKNLEIKQKITTINNLTDRVRDKQREYERYNELDSIIQKIKKLEEYIEKLSQIKERYNILSNIISEYTKKHEILKKYKHIDNINTKTKELSTAIENIKLIENKLNKLKSIVTEIKQMEIVISNTEDDIQKLKENFNKAIGPSCPLCGSPIRKGTVFS